MQVTITIDPRIIADFRDEFLSWTGREATEAEMQKFFQDDIATMYFNTYDEGLADAIEGTFEPADE